ncbi:rRNA maturation RNase YbeY [[Mycoplasma] mobile]|uniref:Endoribonuclease YbeY n=1 Tax=Mycoplasma mobile (strain ATCC 43663 / 163K / NCTC 11711) TaxID=267748 RepID=YBEY_MYCM1|nr:rRNA maturation RNase YbeY [[Mycoplasma] mobile]Q6KHU4.1 RecName: Full=Endoribonuclease YbeY [Mycoplasma mobile 163K]AAT27834.1 putative metal binding protein [Mycoplasma mobile 163K]
MENNLNLCNQTNYRFRYKKDFQNILDEIALFFKEKLPLELDLNIVDNILIKKISKQYYKKDKETDVLSFPSELANMKNALGFFHIGEIFLNYEKVILQAKEYNHSLKREFCYLFTHGIIHLYGYDHVKENEAKEMNAIVESIMQKLNIKRRK